MLIRACARTSSSRSTRAIGADSPSDATGVPPPSPMTSLSDAGPLSDEMPSALPPAASMTNWGGDGGGGHDGSSTVNVRRREASAHESSVALTDAANTTPTYSSDAGSPSDWMPSSIEAGSPSDWMPAASPLGGLTVVLPASDTCVSQKARGLILQETQCHVHASTCLLVGKRRRRRRELENELVTGGRHELKFELFEHV